MTKAQATFVESYLAEHTHDMDSQEEVQAQAEEAMRLFKEIAENPHMICKECGFFMGESYVYCGASADGVCPECGSDDGNLSDTSLKEREDLKKCYVQRWVEVVDLSFLMELGRQEKLKEVENFDLQQVIEAIQNLEVDINFKDSDMTCDHCEKEFGSNEETCLHEGDLYCVECFNNIDTN